MTLGEYLEEHNLNYDEVVLKVEDGRVVTDYGCLIQYCDVLKVDGKELTIR